MAALNESILDTYSLTDINSIVELKRDKRKIGGISSLIRK